MESVKKSIDERAQLKRQYDRRVNKRLMQIQESKVVSSKALDASLVVTRCSGTKSDEHITSSSSGTYITHVVDADIRPVNDQVSSAEISSGHRFSPKTTSAMYEKISPRTYLRWKPTGKIITTVGLKWIPTGKLFDSCTSKVDSEPPNGSNDDITNPYECNQTLNVSAVQASLFNDKWRLQTTLQAPFLKEKKVKLTPGYISSGLVQNPVSPTPYVPPSKKDYEILFKPLFDEYFNPLPCAVSLDPVAVAAQEQLIQPIHLHQLPLIKMYHLLVLHQQIRKFNLKSLMKVLKN
ncbi:hypothetical protein Tco_1502471 [Tanacetum coccineum]